MSVGIIGWLPVIGLPGGSFVLVQPIAASDNSAATIINQWIRIATSSGAGLALTMQQALPA